VSALPLVRVRLKYPDVETLVERFAPNVTRGGIFLASREPRAVGSLVRFEISLLNGTLVLAGEGKVSWVKPFDPTTPARPHGMGVSFTRIDPACREMFKRLVDRRENSPPVRRPGPGGDDRSATRQPAPAFSPELESIDDGAFRRAVDRARVLAGRVENLEDLLLKDAGEAPSLEQALADLPRLLQSRRSGGAATPRAGVPVTGSTDVPAASPNETLQNGQHEPEVDANTEPNGLRADN
jgi:uncharacterized protein (TIGR02266 family)